MLHALCIQEECQKNFTSKFANNNTLNKKKKIVENAIKQQRADTKENAQKRKNQYKLSSF